MSPNAALNAFLRLFFLSTTIAPVFENFVDATNVETVTTTSEQLLISKGHLQPFGESGANLEIEERTEFPKPDEFIINYVQRSKPLKLSGVARNSRAVRLWTDEYLLSLDVPQDSVIQLETKKKENRMQERVEMHFHEFLRVYNHTEHYMVDEVPSFLRPDVMVPCSLQCKELMEDMLSLAVMWFSSGGTKSVVHSDDYDNINCLIRGQKTFVMVDPARDRDKFQLSWKGGYSDLDVDSVDLEKYPDVGRVEFYHVNITAGDCLYIPYRWIHQVRSFNSNVAVNFWWDHYAAIHLLQQDESVCQDACDPSLTLDQMTFTGLNKKLNYENLRDEIGEFAIDDPITESDMVDILGEEFPEDGENAAREFFTKLDLNDDGVVTREEHGDIPVETWKEIQVRMSSLTAVHKARAEDDDQTEDTRDEL